MASTISKFVVKTLCDNQGSLDFGSLNAKLERRFTVAAEILRNVLFDTEKIAIHPSPGPSRSIGLQSRIVAKTGLRLCQNKAADCRLCDGLHLCRYLVCGTCTFGYKCKNQHQVHSPHNVELLRKHDLQDLTENQLFQLLLQNDPFLLPEICSHYNKGTCRFNDSCTKLHVCLHQVQGDCKFGASCKRSHRLSVSGNKALHGFSPERLFVIYRNKCIISQQERPAPASPVGPEVRRPPLLPAPHTSHSTPGPSTAIAEKSEICLFFLRKNCSYKDKCVRMHWHLPYRWQVLDSDAVTWKDLPNMEEIEEAYCDPKHDTSLESALSYDQLMRLLTISSPQEPAVDFLHMTFKGRQVRRLSTVSSASKPPHFVLTTEWLWYWRDDGGSWQEFGQSAEGDPTTVTSDTLETLYLTDRESTVPFGTSKNTYLLHFKAASGLLPMYQENLKFQTRREVRRRPRFVSAHDVEAKLGRGSSHGPNATDIIPSHWDKNNQPDVGYKMVSLDRTSKEFNMIRKLFSVTMHQHRINSIHRIQNLSLWGIFHWQREQMKLRNGGKPVTEQYLFHGTDPALVEAICEQNFDWRMCGVHGTAYGRGSYFARDASYSNKYVQARGGRKVMFAALVLVGDCTKGSSHYLRPPPKGNSNTLYDSCVDQTTSPSIYVIFEKQQIYPEYIIDYS